MDSAEDNQGGGYIGRLRPLIGTQLLHVPGAVMFLEDPDGNILQQRRADNGLWCMPGGGAEDGQDALEQILRETHEETGLTVHDAKPWGFASNPDYQVLTYPNGDICHYHDLLFHGTSWSGELTLCEETLELKWAPVTERTNMMKAADRHLDAFVRYKETGKFQMI